VVKLKEKFFVLPSEIPFDRMRDHELEECVYWLLDDMGAKELTWRVGGKGKGTADGGRDLEAMFAIPTPDGEVSMQRWWIDPKGRKSTVEKAAVQDAVLNAQGRDDIDILVIATNTTFSNPTRDWVTETTKTRPRPRVRLWDRTDFERLLPKHPTAALRLFSRALSPQGRLEAISKKFWEFGGYADSKSLAELWRERENVDWDAQSYFAIIASEVAIGNTARRPWTAVMEPEDIAGSFMIAMANVFYLVQRIEAAGNEQYPLICAAAHLLIGCSLRFEVDVTKGILEGALSREDGTPYPREVLDMFFTPVLERAFLEMRDVCSDDCSRVIISDGDKELSVNRRDVYWQRFSYDPKRDNEEEDRGVLILQSTKNACKIGFELSEEVGCPLVDLDTDQNFDIEESLEHLRIVAKSRLGIAQEEGKA
jgi:hypothetical protein